jgi:hypothetical protein
MGRDLSLVVLVLATFVWVASEADTAILNASGKITQLRVHDVGTKYGPPGDQLDAEVIMWISSKPGMAFGFQLRPDENRNARFGMLNLLRDAFNNNWTVSIDCDIASGKKNGRIFRVWLTKP